MQNSEFSTRITSPCRWIDPTCGFCMQNSDFWTRITSLCGSQTSPVIFYMQNGVPSIRNTSLQGSHPSRVVFGRKTATYGPDKQVSMGPRHDLSLCECKTAWFASDLLVSMSQTKHVILCMENSNFSTWITSLYVSLPSCVVFGYNRATFGPEKQVSISPRHNLSLCACKIAWLAPELLVSMCPNPHLWFLHAKQRILYQNFKSLWVPDFICGFEHT